MSNQFSLKAPKCIKPPLIKMHFTIPRTPQQNGRVKKLNRILDKIAK